MASNEEFLRWRGIETPCPRCAGAGVRVYSNTSTWRGGMGGAMMTTDVCDHCWGSGDKHRNGADLRELERARRDWDDDQCIAHFARKTGASMASTRSHMGEIANILEREERRRKTPFDAERGAFWWFATLRMVTSAFRSFAREKEADRG